MSDPVVVEKLDGGAYWRVVLGGSKGNILDARLLDALSTVLAEAAADRHVKALCLEGDGPHFSFGASVAEHLPANVEAMLTQFHGLLLGLIDASVIILAAVRGQCLGGAMELVTVCHRVFASRDAKFGQPEIALGVFAPAASVLLAERVGRGAAEDLCLSGRSIAADEAFRIGLVDQIVDADPATAAAEYARTYLLPRSASSLRLAAKAVRVGLRSRLCAELPEVERIYLNELMATQDAVEGLNAFLEEADRGLAGPMSGTSDLQELIERAERVYRDYSLRTVVDWKARTGGLAIGYMPIYVPRELLHAQGVLPVGLMGGRDDLEIIKGDAYYQSYICHIPRSTIELGLNGRLDCLDGVLFPAICDVIRNLSGMWAMLFPGKYVRYLDVPQNFDAGVGGAFYLRELQSIAGDLEARGALALDPERLRASIAVFNDNRRLVRELYELRARQPWKVPTHELYVLLRASVVMPVEESTALLAQYSALVQADLSRQPLDQARVLLTGSFCEQPPLGLIRTLERAGCYIVDDDFVQIHRDLQHDILLDADPLQSLVTAYLEDGVASPTRYIGDGIKGEALLRRARENGAEGVLFCAPSFCDPALLDQPMLVRAVERAGVAWTAFKYSENGGQFQVIREQAGTFADSIKLWSGA